jgi:hypothetical protein
LGITGKLSQLTSFLFQSHFLQQIADLVVNVGARRLLGEGDDCGSEENQRNNGQ